MGRNDGQATVDEEKKMNTVVDLRTWRADRAVCVERNREVRDGRYGNGKKL